MGASRFDDLTRAFGSASSRRAAVATLVVAVGLARRFLGHHEAPANKRQTPKSANAKRNAFGCLAVGQNCRGKDRRCCSGICQGTKPKPGEQDTSTCAGHDEGTCQADQQRLECGGAQDVRCTNAAGIAGHCAVTTGNAGYCLHDVACYPCRKDTDCEPFCGAGAACIPCAGRCADHGGTACAGIEDCIFP